MQCSGCTLYGPTRSLAGRIFPMITLIFSCVIIMSQSALADPPVTLLVRAQGDDPQWTNLSEASGASALSEDLRALRQALAALDLTLGGSSGSGDDRTEAEETESLDRVILIDDVSQGSSVPRGLGRAVRRVGDREMVVPRRFRSARHGVVLVVGEAYGRQILDGEGGGARWQSMIRQAAAGESVEDASGESQGIVIGGRQGRDVPEHLDWQLATIEESYHSGVERQNNCRLVEDARSKNQQLLHPTSPMGPCQRAAIARSLILITETLDERLQAGQRECLEWDEDDPLGGTLESISPFSMLDTWTAIHSEESRNCPSRGSDTPPRRRRRPEGPTARIDYAQDSAYRPARGQNNVVTGVRIFLSAENSENPGGGSLTYQWELRYSDPGEGRVSDARLRDPRNQRTPFTPDVVGSYRVMLTVTDARGRSDRVLAVFTTRGTTPDPTPGPAPSEPRDRDRPRRTSEECAECEIAGVRGYVSGGRYFYGACATLHATICYGRYDCHTDRCRGVEACQNPVYTAAFNQGIDDVRAGRVCRRRQLRDRLYRLGVDHERRRQGRMDQPTRYGECPPEWR